MAQTTQTSNAPTHATPPGDPLEPSDPIDAIDAQLLDALQANIPITESPWTQIGAALNLDAEETLQRVRALKDSGIIRHISPIFDSRALGYQSVLAAAIVDPGHIEQAAEVINAHPGVSHNYERQAQYNLWFTLAIAPEKNLQDELNTLAQSAGLTTCHALPATRTFRIGMKLNIADTTAPNSQLGQGATGGLPASVPHHKAHKPLNLTPFDKRAIAITQNDLPLEPNPFQAACDSLNITITELSNWMDYMRAHGALRRVAAILRHRQAGFTANGMGVWNAPPQVIETAGRLAGAFPPVTHCYERPMFDDWPYNLYTMIHARTTGECESIANGIARELNPLGVQGPRLLYSTREFKKQRVRYFVESTPGMTN